MKKLKSILLGLLCISLLSVPALAAPSQWAAGEVAQAIERGYVPKELQSNYQEPITRGEFAKIAVTFAAKKLGYTTEEFLDYCKSYTPVLSQYKDTSDPYVLAASLANIIYGLGDGTFGPDRKITRQEAAVMLSRTHDVHSYIPSDYSADLWEEFTATCQDASEVADWATEGVARLYHYSVMSDVGGNVYAPRQSYTREQSIVTFLRMEKNLPDSGNGRMPQKRTQEEVIAALSKEDYDKKLVQRWDTPYCVILHTRLQGTPHGSYDSLNFVYPNGAAPDVTVQLPEIDPRSGLGKYPKPKNIRISDDKTTLLFDVEGTYRVYPNGTDADPVEYPYAGTYSVDLATGLLTPLQSMSQK